MASCVKCGATLIALARFCATCGSPVTRGSAPPPAPPPKTAVPSVPDPFAQTVLGGDVRAVLERAEGAAVSPMAASRMTNQASGPQAPVPANAAPAPQMPRPSASPPAPHAQYAQPPAPQPQGIPPGTLVLVYWADGQRYPGTVLQVAQNHLFIAFPNGVQQWIDARYVTVGG